jgi:hypothetical protein
MLSATITGNKAEEGVERASVVKRSRDLQQRSRIFAADFMRRGAFNTAHFTFYNAR